jgi:hypothetical protein
MWNIHEWCCNGKEAMEKQFEDLENLQTWVNKRN